MYDSPKADIPYTIHVFCAHLCVYLRLWVSEFVCVCVCVCLVVANSVTNPHSLHPPLPTTVHAICREVLMRSLPMTSPDVHPAQVAMDRRKLPFLLLEKSCKT